MECESITSLIEANKVQSALSALRSFLGHDPSQRKIQFTLKSIDKLKIANQVDFTPVPIALLSSFTIDPLIPYLKAFAYTDRLDLCPYIGPFDQVQQEVLNPASELFQHSPKIVILALRSADLAGSLFHRFTAAAENNMVENEIEEILQTIKKLFQSIRRYSDAMILIHNFDPPINPVLGIIDTQLMYGQIHSFHELNSRLAQLANSLENIFVLDYAQLVLTVGHNQWYDPRMWFLARQPLSMKALPRLAETQLSFIRPLYNKNRKCLVLDLDDTLWGGVIGEDGLSGIKIGQDYPGNAFRSFQEAILKLHDRGIILGLNSRNNESDVFPVFENHSEMILKKEHFSAIRINWNDKASNLRSISEELNIGLDHIAFIDDSPTERELIRTFIPEVLVVDLPPDPSDYTGVLERITDFNSITYSEEDRTRTLMYRTESDRQQLRESVDSLEDFYWKLKMHVLIGEAAEDNIPRLCQLTQKTNQFNLTTERYSESDITRFSKSPSYRVYYLELNDRFGSSGIVGLAIIYIKDNVWEINSMLLSCRVLGKTVEQALIAFIAKQAHKSGATVLRGYYRLTKKNVHVAQFYSDSGFHQITSSEKETIWELSPADTTLTIPKWISLSILT